MKNKIGIVSASGGPKKIVIKTDIVTPLSINDRTEIIEFLAP